MASVRVRKETGLLFLDFRYRGLRCREQTLMPDTYANRKKAEKVLQRIVRAIAEGSFDYAKEFPGSKLAARARSTTAVGSIERVWTELASATPVSMELAVPPTPLFKDFTAQWKLNHIVEWRRSHVRVLDSTLDGHLLPFFGERPVGSITKSDVLAFRAKLATLPGRGGKTMGNKRINGIMGPLRQILNEAAEVYGFNSPVTNLKPLRLRKTDVQPFTLDEVQSILANVRADYRDYFAVRFFTGMRTGEIHGLKWKYVDFTDRLILVRETFVLGEDEYTKTDGSQREIQMNQVVYEALARQKEATGSISEYVFCNTNGHPLDNKNFTDRVWLPLLRMLRLEERRPYQMRHTAATLWLAAGEAPEWIARGRQDFCV